MRKTRFGLLLLIAATPGCAGLDTTGYGEHYNGFPWPWLMTKAPPKSRTDTLIQHPEYAPAERFAKSVPGSTTAVGTTETLEESPPQGDPKAPAE